MITACIASGLIFDSEGRKMTTFFFTLFLLVAAVSISVTNGDCSYTACKTPTGSESTYCKTAKTYLDCLQTSVVENDKCTDSVIKASVKAVIANVNTALENTECGVSGLMSSISVVLLLSALAYIFSK